MGIAAKFISIDAQVQRVRLLLNATPTDQSLHKELNSLIKAREKILLEIDRERKTHLSNENRRKLKGEAS